MNGLPRRQDLIEASIEPCVEFTLVSRDAALKIDARLAVLVIPDHGA